MQHNADIALALDRLKYGDQETTKHTLKWLQYVSGNPAKLLGIHQLNGIPILVKLLSVDDESISFPAIQILQNLLLYQEDSKAALCKVSGLQKIVKLLKSTNEEFLSAVINCLGILAYKNQENKLLIVSCNVLADLVRIMKTYNSPSLLIITSGVLKFLSSCPFIKRVIIAADSVQVLAMHLDNPSQNLVSNCLWTLRNLSDKLAEQGSDTLTTTLPILVQHLGSRNKIIVSCTVGLLSNLTCNNPRNKVIVCQVKGIDALLKAILKAGSDEEIIEPAVCCLGNLTNRHPEVETAQNDIRLLSGLEIIVKFLEPPSRWPLIKAVIGLIRNLAFCPNNHEALITLSTVHILRDMIHSVYQDILRKREISSHEETRATLIEGIKMEVIVENILTIFLKLAPNAKVKALLKNPTTMNTFHQILYKETEKVQGIITDIFRVIAFDPNEISSVRSAIGVSSLHSSFNSSSEGIATSKSLPANKKTLMDIVNKLILEKKLQSST